MNTLGVGVITLAVHSVPNSTDLTILKINLKGNNLMNFKIGSIFHEIISIDITIESRWYVINSSFWSNAYLAF